MSDVARENALIAINKFNDELKLDDLPEPDTYFQTLNFYYLHQHNFFSPAMRVRVCEGMIDLSNSVWKWDTAGKDTKCVVFLTLRDWLDLAHFRTPPKEVQFHVFARSKGLKRSWRGHLPKSK